MQSNHELLYKVPQQAESKLHISVENGAGAFSGAPIRVLHCAGAVDSKTVTSFETTVLDLLAQHYANLVFDMSDITHISVAGIGALVAASREAQAQSGKVILAAMPPRLTHLFGLLGCNRLVPTCPTISDALDCFH